LCVCVFVCKYFEFCTDGRKSVCPYIEISIRLCHRSRLILLLNKSDGNFNCSACKAPSVGSCLSVLFLFYADECVHPSRFNEQPRPIDLNCVFFFCCTSTPAGRTDWLMYDWTETELK
jgi:hypothetical protein